MPVDFNKFVDWASNKLSPIDIRGNEIRINSIFCHDQKKHLWCNPYGGKNKIEYGVYHCWKTDKKGTLVNLVMLVEKCDFKKSLEILGLHRPLLLASDSFDFDLDFESPKSPENWESSFIELQMPPFCQPINKTPEPWYTRAKKYLDSRKIDPSRFYFCVGGKYEGRIVIPYYSPNQKLIYFNGRTILDSKLRYKGPEKECGVGKEDVLFFTNHGNYGDKYYLCEGEFDAISLHQLGLNAVACGGKYLSDKQAVQLSPYKICLALDSDEAGQESLIKMKQKISQYGSSNISVVKPPNQIKDWNEFYCKFDPKIILGYIGSTEKSF
jgi:hypothetical protein